MNIAAIVTEDVRNHQAGDWRFDERGNLTVSSVPLGDWRMELLIQVHELVEASLCKHRGITDEMVTCFDAFFEEERARGMHTEQDENGDDPRSCYCKEHFCATNIERQLAAELGVQWKEYERAILDYFYPPTKII